jgi:hypothetical protein
VLKNSFSAGILKVNDENSRIRIHPKMSWIRNTGFWESCVLDLDLYFLFDADPEFRTNFSDSDPHPMF